MAEYAERKLRNAKLSVALAVAAILGGLAARDQTAGAAAGTEKGAEPHLAPITSADIKNSSLLFKDFKAGQVYSDNQVNHKFLKIDDANNTFIKLDDANNTFVKIADANNTFVKQADANNTFVKIADAKHQFIQGDGSVLTGFEAQSGDGHSDRARASQHRSRRGCRYGRAERHTRESDQPRHDAASLRHRRHRWRDRARQGSRPS